MKVKLWQRVALSALIQATALPAIRGVAQPIVEYPIPTFGYANSIVAGPDGAVWFTEGLANKIGRITSDGTISEYQLPPPVEVREITVGFGNLWYTKFGGPEGFIGLLTTSGVATEFPLPLFAFSNPSGITQGPDRALWFVDGYRRKIGRFMAGNVTGFEFGTPSNIFTPESITTGPDGALWFTDAVSNRIGRITTAGELNFFSIPTPHGGPSGITTGPDQALWFAESGGNRIGRITPQGEVTEFQIPTANAQPARITAAPDDAMWFTEYIGNKIGRITTEGLIREFPIPRARSFPLGITADRNGSIWFVESTQTPSRIGRLALISTVDVPAASKWMLALCALILALVGLLRLSSP